LAVGADDAAPVSSISVRGDEVAEAFFLPLRSGPLDGDGEIRRLMMSMVDRKVIIQNMMFNG
jgi:hypothetical protein